jgi:hypothetical protein
LGLKITKVPLLPLTFTKPSIEIAPEEFSVATAPAPLELEGLALSPPRIVISPLVVLRRTLACAVTSVFNVMTPAETDPLLVKSIDPAELTTNSSKPLIASPKVRPPRPAVMVKFSKAISESALRVLRKDIPPPLAPLAVVFKTIDSFAVTGDPKLITPPDVVILPFKKIAELPLPIVREVTGTRVSTPPTIFVPTSWKVSVAPEFTGLIVRPKAPEMELEAKNGPDN